MGTDLCDVLVVWIKAQRKLACICVCVLKGLTSRQLSLAWAWPQPPRRVGPEPEEGLLLVLLPYTVVTSGQDPTAPFRGWNSGFLQRWAINGWNGGGSLFMKYFSSNLECCCINNKESSLGGAGGELSC